MRGTKGAPTKETHANGLYQWELTVLRNPFRKTDQGVCVSGEAKGYKPRSRSESDRPAV